MPTTNYPFLFSDQPLHRVRRHVTFWLCWWVFQSFLYSFAAFATQVPFYIQIWISAMEAMLYLLCHMFLSYSLMYGVIPLLLKGKYFRTVASVLILFFLTALFSALVGMYAVRPLRDVLLPQRYNYGPHITMVDFYLALLAGLRGAITVGGLAAAIKLAKYWYVKEQQNAQLQKEKISAQLALLQSQVHPHFLFNTMNTIYANTQEKAPEAARLVAGLSDMLRYMLYECNEPLVPLDKEMKLLKDYITLEKARYDERLELVMELPETAGNWQIAPLLLLPLVENSFKHGASCMPEHPWIHLHISINDGQLSMKLVNGKTMVPQNEVQRHGLGLDNVKKRLMLLYPEKHQLQIFDEEDLFIVSLKLELTSFSPYENQPSTETATPHYV